MMKTNFIFYIATTLLLTHSIAIWADDDHDRAKILLDTGKVLPLETILENARKIHSGKILEVELETENQLIIYEIELLTASGRVLELKFDAKTGQLLSTEEED